MSLYRAPTVLLSDICGRFSALSYEEALKTATCNELPEPTFRLSPAARRRWWFPART
jgi:hypothetical protein